MKRLFSSRAIAMLLTLFAMSGSTLFADVDDFELSVRNVTQPTANTLEFDLYLRDTDDLQPFEFASLQMGLLLNSSIYGVGTLTVSYSNAGSGLDGDQQFVGSVDAVGSLAGYPGQTLIRLAANSLPPVPPGAGSGTVISSTGEGTFLARFTITSSVSFTPNTRPNLVFCGSLAVLPLFPTILNSYINGDATPLAVTSGIDAVVDGNPLLNATLPAIFNVTGTGTFCQGGAGLAVGLDGSEVGATYTLYRNGLEPEIFTGTGAALSFGLRTAGTYTVTATNAAGDENMNGQAVITETPNNTITLTSAVGTNSQSVCINTVIDEITYSTTGATGATFSGLPLGVDGAWTAGTVTISGTPTAAGTSNYTIILTGGCGTVNATGTIAVNSSPSVSITGSNPICVGATTTLSPTAGGTWSSSNTSVATVSATGVVTGIAAGTATFTFTSATTGCSNTTGTVTVNLCSRSLALSSVFLEGLYDTNGTMRQAMGDSGPQWPAGIADHISVELHNSPDYSIIEFSITDIELTTSGTASVTVPSEYSGLYYITIKHRNHIETTTSLPVSFSNTTIAYAFDAPSKVYGNNMKEVDVAFGYYAIYGGDVTQDGYVDSGDYPDVVNDNFNYRTGYLVTDINGDSWVDSGDYPILVNNNFNYVSAYLPTGGK